MDTPFQSNNAAYMSALAESGIKLREEHFVASTDSHLVHWQLTRAGIGIGIMSAELAEHFEPRR